MEREWTSDCQQCMGLCCVALPYMESADFPSDKPIGEPCVHLSTMNHCAIHDSLRTCGYKAVSPMSALGQVSMYLKRSMRNRAGERIPTCLKRCLLFFRLFSEFMR